MNEETNTPRDDENPIGEMSPPGRIKHGLRTMALAGMTVGLGVAGAVGVSADITTVSPPLTL